MEPKVWGRYLWTSIHSIALGYPDEPSEKDKKDFRDFYTNLWKVIPCQRCSDNYQRHLTELPIDGFLGTNTDLFKWTVDLHNIVNKELGKQTIPLKQAEEIFAKLAQGDHSILGGLDKRWEQFTLYVTYFVVGVIIIIALLWLISRYYSR
jgi:hypothetical protein